MNTFKDLLIWQKSMNIVTEIYHLTNSFPKEEIYGLSSQIRRCSIQYPVILQKDTGEMEIVII